MEGREGNEGQEKKEGGKEWKERALNTVVYNVHKKTSPCVVEKVTTR